MWFIYVVQEFMLVKELRQLLQNLDDNLLVVLSSDEEGNKISTLSEIQKC